MMSNDKTAFAAAFVFFVAAMAGRAQAGEPKVVGANAVVNGGFEEGNKGWNSSLKIVESPVFSGKRACMIVGGSEKPKVIAVQSFVPLKPRTYYKFSMSVRRTTGQGYLYVHCNYYEAPGKRLMSSKNWSAGRAVPVTIRTGEGTGRWQSFSGVFRCMRGDCGGVQLVMFIRNGEDTAYIDDVSIREVKYPDAPPWKFPDAVLFPGRPSKFHMSVEDASAEGGRFSVRTTGAAYVLDADGGTLTCGQRIGTKREVALVRFGTKLGKMSIVRKDADVCVVAGEDIAFGFQGDSLVTVATNVPLPFTVESRIGAKHFRSTDCDLLAIDDDGGFCVTPYARPRLSSPGSLMTKPPAGTSEPGWKAEYRIGARDTARCPEPEVLRAFREHANVLFLFGGIYEQHPGGYTHAPYAVARPEVLKRTIREAHKLGMQVICYRHVSSYGWAGIGLDDALADMKKFRDEYKFDGWYFDGLWIADPWMKTYKFIRTVRERVGEGVIYTHCTLNPPARMTELYCPFIDSYSDFLLRGEGQIINGVKDPYLRYVIGTYNISNAFATLKGDKMMVAEGSQQKASLRDKLDVMLRLNGRCRWAYPSFPYRKCDTEDYIGFYFKELDRQQAQWQRMRKPLPIRWP